MDAIKNWFCGFEKGIACLTAEQREVFFRECGKNCVQSGVLNIYRQVYDEVEGDLDRFFTQLNDFDGVRAEVVESGGLYHLYFLECVCPLHQEGYIRTPLLCECSRQSVLYTMRTLWPDKQFEVKLCQSVLRGDKACKLSIQVI